MFNLRISTVNDAFEDARGPELARILREVARQIDNGRESGTAVDCNGNQVGAWKITGGRS